MLQGYTCHQHVPSHFLSWEAGDASAVESASAEASALDMLKDLGI